MRDYEGDLCLKEIFDAIQKAKLNGFDQNELIKALYFISFQLAEELYYDEHKETLDPFQIYGFIQYTMFNCFDTHVKANSTQDEE